MVEKVYSRLGNSGNQDRLVNYPVLTTNTTSDPIAAMAQAIQTMYNKISEWDRASRPVYHQQPSNFPPSSQASHSAYPRSRSPQSRSNIICYNCMQPGHINLYCPHPLVSSEQYRQNQQEVWRKQQSNTPTSNLQSQSSSSQSLQNHQQPTVATESSSSQPPVRHVSFAGNVGIPEFTILKRSSEATEAVGIPAVRGKKSVPRPAPYSVQSQSSRSNTVPTSPAPMTTRSQT
jgi:hypothetical protein